MLRGRTRVARRGRRRARAAPGQGPGTRLPRVVASASAVPTGATQQLTRKGQRIVRPGRASARSENLAGCAPPYRGRVVAGEQPRETAPRAGREHDRVAVKLLRPLGDRPVGGTEEHREVRRRFHEPRCPFEIGACAVEQDVIPDARSSGPARNPSQRSLQLHHDDDRQARPALLGQEIGSDDRLISLRRSVVGHKEVTVVGNAAQRNGGDGI